MVTFYRSGDKSRAICSQCGKVVATTFQYRTVPFDDGKGSAPNILVGVCDDCDGVVSIPAQSTVAIRQARETATIPLEVSLPAREVELLDFAAFRIDPDATTRFRKPLIVFFLNDLMSQADTLATLGQDVKAWLDSLYPRQESTFLKEPKRRISIKFSPKMDRRIAEGMRESGLTKTWLIHAAIMRATIDVVERPVKAKIAELRNIARVINA